MNRKALISFALTLIYFSIIVSTESSSQINSLLVSVDHLIPVSGHKISGIDHLDTITFDLSQAVCSNGTVTFPVSISSDDVIWALDFSMKWDLTKASYNSVISHKSYIMPTANYNIGDSTLRFSSFSMLAMEHNVALVSVKLNLIAGQINAEDLDIVSVLLNGSASSFKVIDGPPATSVSVVGNINILPGDTTTLVATSTSPGCSYQWSTGSGSNLIFVTNPGTYSVTVSNTNGCSSSAFVTINIANPLPVELLYFTGVATESEIHLKWATGSEHNNSHFNVYRSHDLLEYKFLGSVNSVGNSNITNSYDFFDGSSVPGENYYMLEQLDLDGTAMQFPPIVVRQGYLSVDETESVKVFPNPVKGKSMNIVASGISTGTRWSIYSFTGAHIRTLTDIHSVPQNPGDQVFFHIETDLFPGAYLLHGTDGHKSLNTKFIVE